MATDPHGIMDSSLGESLRDEHSNYQSDIVNSAGNQGDQGGDIVENPVTTPEIEPGNIPGVEPENIPITEPEIAPGKIPDDSLIPQK